jgi:hypothetical protein
MKTTRIQKLIAATVAAILSISRASPAAPNCSAALAQIQNNKGAVIAQCAVLHPDNALQAVVVTARGKASPKFGVPVSEMHIFRWTGDKWLSVLILDNAVHNPAGYIGIDFLTDTPSNFWVRMSTTQKGLFRILVFYGQPNDKPDTEGLPIEVGWNNEVGRYQEIAPNGEGFVTELKNPPHRK